MAVLDPSSTTRVPAHSGIRVPRPRALRLEPLVELEWARAVQRDDEPRTAKCPSDIRKAWVHRAEQEHVIALFQAVASVNPSTDAPWWLRALAQGTLASRDAGFAVEDEVAAMLAARAGWVYVAWTGAGEDGYWEYLPSEGTSGAPTIPTTVLLTHRHPGWVDVVPAHTGNAPPAFTLRGPSGLLGALPEIEQEPSKPS
ncbi:MAG: hypothetical protein ACRDRN_20210 [Sciscionella sp.]